MKSEAPTEAKLESLREEGIVSISPFASHCLGVSGALATLALGFKKIELSIPFVCTDAVHCTEYVSYLKDLLLRGIMYPLCAYVVLYLAASLIQSRGFFRVSFGRRRFGERLNEMGAMQRIVFWLCGFALIWFGFGLYVRSVTEIFALPVSNIVPALSDKLFSRLLVSAGVIGVTAGVSGIIGHLLFRREHRMTREEIQREARQ